MILENGFDTIREPWSHQLETIRIAGPLRDYALFYEPGTGKSLTSILVSRHKMHEAKRRMRVLVIAPPIVLPNWKSEWKAASKFTDEQIQFTSGSGKERLKIFTPDVFVAITNYETLLMKDVFQAILAWGPEIIIFDEVHRAKSISAKRTKACVVLSQHPTVRHRYILTGTPVLNSPLDLFSQFLILDKGETFGKNFYEYRGKYFFDKNAGMPAQKHFPDWKIRPGAVDNITGLIKKKSAYVKKSECLDLPPLIRKRIAVELSPEQKKLYDQMARDFIAYADSGAAVAQLALTKALRLQQIVSGFLTVEDLHGTAGIHRIDKNPRASALEEILEDLAPASKVILWACFKEDYRLLRSICERLKLRFVELTGETSAPDRQKALDLFDTDIDVRVCIANQGSGGIGANMVASNVSIYYSRNCSLEHDVQSSARNYRGGSEIHSCVTRYDLVAEGTIDEMILQRLENKEAVSTKVLNELVMEVKSGLNHGTRPGNRKAVPAQRRAQGTPSQIGG